MIWTQYLVNSVALVRKQKLYWLSDRRLLAKLVPTFADTEGDVWSAQRIPMAVNLDFLDRSCYFSI
jgi:hypothetical protein